MSLKRSLLALLLVPIAAGAIPIEKYFGYFGGDYTSASAANPGGPGFAEMHDHINLYSILIWSAVGTAEGKAGSETYVLQELAKARAAHVHAIVPAFPFVFQATLDQSTGQNSCDVLDPDASRAWSSLAQKMVDQGYLIPGDPARSTVVATYIVDEPNLPEHCLGDINGQANPAWINAINAIRQGPGTTNLPIASILADGFQKGNDMRQGMQLLDWVGFDHYGDSDSEWQSTMNDLKSIAPGKKYIVVPGAMEGCKDVYVDSTNRFFNAIENDPDVTWIAPFEWQSGSPTCKGIRDIPALKNTYTNEGNKIRNLQCSASPGDKWFCGGSGNLAPVINLLLDD